MAEEVKIGKKTGLAIIAISTLLMWHFMSGGSSKTPPEVSQHTKELVWVEKSKDAVRSRLKDPNSAEFKDVHFSDAGGTPVACGQVNSKNTYGGYTGFQHFVAAGENMAFFERETDDFSKVWNEMCVH